MTTIGRGLTLAGMHLGQGMSRRYQNKKMQALMEALLTQGNEMPGYDQSMQLTNALVPQAPLKNLSPMDPSKDPMNQPGFIETRDKAQGVYDERAAKQNELLKAMMMSGDPQMQQMAISMSPKMQAMMPKPPPLRGAQRFMNLGNGKVLDMQSQSIMDYAESPLAKMENDPALRFKTVESGGSKVILDMLPTLSGEQPVPVWQGTPEQDVKFETVGAGGDTKQRVAYTTENGKIVAEQELGKPMSTVQKVVQTNVEGAEGSMSDNAVWQRKMITDVGVANNASTRVGRIYENFDPFYQSYLGKLSKWGLQAADKWLPSGLPKGKAKDLLTSMSQFEQDTNTNMNLYIKEITGAQMSEAEAARLSKAVANLGDSPTVFKAKLDNAQKVLKEAALVMEKEMEFYGSLDNPMDYDEALKYAKKKAAVYITNGIDKFNEDNPEAVREDAGGGSGDGPGFPAPEGYTWKKESDGSWTPIKGG